MHSSYNKCKAKLTNYCLIIMSHLIQKHPHAKCDRGTMQKGLKNKETNKQIKTEDKRRIRQESQIRNSAKQARLHGKKKITTWICQYLSDWLSEHMPFHCNLWNAVSSAATQIKETKKAELFRQFSSQPHYKESSFQVVPLMTLART